MPSTFCRRNPEFQDAYPAHLHSVGPTSREMAAIDLGSARLHAARKHDINVGIRWEDDTTAPVWAGLGCTCCASPEHAISPALMGAALKNGIKRGQGSVAHNAIVYALDRSPMRDYRATMASDVAIKRTYHLLGWVAWDSSCHGRSRRNGEIRLANTTSTASHSLYARPL